MSYVFDVDGATIWSPSLKVGQLFVEQVHALESCVGDDSGFKQVAADMVEIELAKFEHFASRLPLSSGGAHSVLAALAAPVAAICAALLRRTGSKTLETTWPGQVLEESLRLERLMPM